MKFKSLATVAALGIICVFGWMMAFFSSTDAVTNRLIAESLDIIITEDNFKDNVIRPLKNIKKDPKILNQSKVDAYVFLLVEIPHDNIRLYTADRKTLKNEIHSPEDTVLFSYRYQDNELDTNRNSYNNASWIEITDKVGITNPYTHLFAYAVTDNGTERMTILNAGDSTPELFDVVRFCDYGEWQYYPWQDSERDEYSTYLSHVENMGDSEKIAYNLGLNREGTISEIIYNNQYDALTKYQDYVSATNSMNDTEILDYRRSLEVYEDKISYAPESVDTYKQYEADMSLLSTDAEKAAYKKGLVEGRPNMPEYDVNVKEKTVIPFMDLSEILTYYADHTAGVPSDSSDAIYGTDLEKQTKNISIRAYGIQAKEISVTDPVQLWTLYLGF